MHALLKFSKAVDWLNTQVGKYAIWLILAATVVSGVNAVIRKLFNMSSNAYLEVQWYFFAASFLLVAVVLGLILTGKLGLWKGEQKWGIVANIGFVVLAFIVMFGLKMIGW